MVSAGPVNAAAMATNEVELLSGSTQAQALVRTLVDPFQPGRPPRYPDPFTLIPTRVNRVSFQLNCPIHNGATASDGSIAFVLRGDHYANYAVPAAVAADHEITWTGGVGYNLVDGYAMSADIMSRPTSFGWRLRFQAIGDPHAVAVHVFELPPHTFSLTLPILPTHTNLGCTSEQKGSREGRDEQLRSGEEVRFVAYPTSVKSCEFLGGGFSRESLSEGSGWSSYVFWVYGLRNTDQIVLEGVASLEAYQKAESAIGTIPQADEAVVTPSTKAMDGVFGGVDKMVAKGANVVKGEPAGIMNYLKRLTSELADEVLAPEKVAGYMKTGIRALSRFVAMRAPATARISGPQSGPQIDHPSAALTEAIPDDDFRPTSAASSSAPARAKSIPPLRGKTPL